MIKEFFVFRILDRENSYGVHYWTFWFLLIVFDILGVFQILFFNFGYSKYNKVLTSSSL